MSVYQCLNVKTYPRYVGVWPYIDSFSRHLTVERFQSLYSGDIMTLYVVHVHSWHVMSRMGIYGALFRDWAAVTDKRNSELAEAPEFGL
jgi:hypothetical protein